MKLVDSNQMKKEDKEASEKYGIPPILLMENAAAQSVKIIDEEISIRGKRILIVCGGGNNGGDGLAMTRHLDNRGYDVTILKLFDENKMTESAATNFNIIKRMKINVVEYSDFKNYDIIIDCILGIGLKGDVRGDIAEVIEEINLSGKTVVSIDVPSGIDADSRKVCKTAVKADYTITMGYCKTGLCTGEGLVYSGKVIVADISLPRNEDARYFFTDSELLENWLPEKNLAANKGNNGTVLIMAGSVGMTGAAYLACAGAMRAGAGIVKLAIPENLNMIMEVKLTEAITLPLKCKNFFDENSADKILEFAKNADVLAIGPGLGRDEQTVKAVHKIIKNTDIPIVIDADGIYAVSENINVLREANVPLILTPHPGEFSRLTGKEIGEINDNRIAIASGFAKEYGVTLLLKGAGTVVALPDGEVYINPTGNEGMAKGGSGDVLTGIIAALWARGTENPAVAGAYIHGKAGDTAAMESGIMQMLPTDLLKYI
ncbi:MAG: NAD(P)H-hydrate dehydratase [Bacillota bacterium]|nr:NAD(P)H-hydrate dehydratase [Bacillota bacterium]